MVLGRLIALFYPNQLHAQGGLTLTLDRGHIG